MKKADYEQKRAFSEADVAAMGQFLLEEVRYATEQWEEAKKGAREEAKQRAVQNDFVAP